MIWGYMFLLIAIAIVSLISAVVAVVLDLILQTFGVDIGGWVFWLSIIITVALVTLIGKKVDVNGGK